MITAIIPKLPSRDLKQTENYYHSFFDCETINTYPNYLLLSLSGMELHFYLDNTLDPLKNNSMLYIRVSEDIQALNDKALAARLPFADLGKLEKKPWGQWEFSLLDPDNTLLTFGQAL